MDLPIKSFLIQCGWHWQTVNFSWRSQLSISVKLYSFITHTPIHSVSENNKASKLFKPKSVFLYLQKRRRPIGGHSLQITEAKTTRSRAVLHRPFPSKKVSSDFKKHYVSWSYCLFCKELSKWKNQLSLKTMNSGCVTQAKKVTRSFLSILRRKANSSDWWMMVCFRLCDQFQFFLWPWSQFLNVLGNYQKRFVRDGNWLKTMNWEK